MIVEHMKSRRIGRLPEKVSSKPDAREEGRHLTSFCEEALGIIGG